MTRTYPSIVLVPIVRRIILLITLVGLLLVAAFVLQTAIQWSQFADLEQRAKQTITPAELQTWAIGLLTQSASHSVSQFLELRTNYPAKLRGLVIELEPSVNIISRNSANGSGNNPEDTNSIALTWGTGFLGHKGFEIGRTNFVAPRGRAWSAGVYFFSK